MKTIKINNQKSVKNIKHKSAKNLGIFMETVSKLEKDNAVIEKEKKKRTAEINKLKAENEELKELELQNNSVISKLNSILKRE